jgi:hypothetical protein
MGQMVGTAEYMAPEQIEGRPVDARTDVYALGIVLFQMLAGEAPFRSTTLQGLLFQHVHTPPRPVRDVNPYISEHLSWIVFKAMAKAPSDRFQSAEEMAQALEAANNNATYPLPPSMPATPGTGQGPQDALKMSSQQRPSFYTQPSQAGAPGLGVASQYGQQVFGNTPAYGTSRSSTHPSGVSAIKPAGRALQRRLLPGYVGAGLVVLLVIVLILAKTGILPFFEGGSTNTSTAAQAFTENFHDNHLQWTIGSVQGLNAGISQNSYMLDIPQAGQASTFFPYPKGVGYLPGNFTWSATMQQTTGQAPYNVFYGLAFRLAQNGSNVSCYAFIINGQGYYEVLKYIPGSNYYTLAQGQSSAIHTGLNQPNALQAKVQGNNFYFSINGAPAGGQGHAITDITGSTPYTNGEPALFVAGSIASEVSFTVTQAQLAIG